MNREVNTNDTTDYVIFDDNREDVEHGDKKNKPKLPPMSRSEILLVFVLCLSQLIVFMGFSILQVFLPIAALKKGLNLEEVGYIFSSFYLGSLVFSPVVGILLTKINLKKVMTVSLIVYSVLLIIFAFTIYLNTPASYLSVCIILRLLQGLTVVGAQTSAFAIVGHRFQNRLGRITGLLEMCNGIAYSLSGALGGMLYELGGYGAPFYFLFSLTVVTTILCWIYIPSDCHNDDARLPFREISILMKHPLIYFAIIPATVAFVQQSFVAAYYSAFMSKVVHTSETIIGISVAIGAVFYAICCHPIGLLVDRGMVRSLIIVGFLIRGISLVAISPQIITGIKPTLINGMVGLTTCALGSVCFLVAIFKYTYMQAMKSGIENSITTSAVIATLLTTVQSLGALIGPLIGGVVIGNGNYSLGFTSAGFLTAFMSVIVFVDLLIHTRCFLKKRKSTSSERARLVINGNH